MKRRLNNALSKQPMNMWSEKLSASRLSLYNKVLNNGTPLMTQLAFLWQPKATARANGHVAHRRVGRPVTRWSDLCD